MSKLWVAVIASALLAACGGNELTTTTCSSSSCGGGTGGSTVTGISIVTSSPQVASDNTGPATITAYAHDANNNTVSGATVTFSATSGLLAVPQATTDTTGAAIASLSAGSDPSNRTITVTASSGTVSSTINVAVIGTQLSLTGPTTLVEPGVGTYTVILKNAGGVGIEGQAVALSSANKNTLNATSVTTDVNGQATFTVTAANGGSDTLSATALGLSATESVAVSTQSFAITAPAANAQIKLGVVSTVSVLWTNGGTPVNGQVINFAATRGTLSTATATTDATGKASVTISSTVAGPSVITASGSGVSTQVTVDFLATNPSNIAVQATPSTINVSAQSTITAVLRDAQDNLVEGQLVDFSLTDVTGGTLSVASALTNDQGVAQTIYTASTTTSATNGVSVKATAEGFPTVMDTATLTVAGKTLFLSLGTGNTIDILNETQYGTPYSVLAIDGAGNPATGVTIQLTTESVYYVKGYYCNPTLQPTVCSGTSWVQIDSITTLPNPCPSEDVNNNGILDKNEDYNSNGKLDPGAVAAASPGSVVTSTTATASLPAGAATFEVVYPKDHAYWVGIKLTATATVAGTESSTSTSFLLQGVAADYQTLTISPPGQLSPYGRANACSNPN